MTKNLNKEGSILKRKFLYFIIACVFAIVTTSSAAQNTSLPVFRERQLIEYLKIYKKIMKKIIQFLQLKKLIWKKGLLIKMKLYIWKIC